MIFHLSSPWAIAINIVVWLVIHVGVSMSIAKMRPESFDPQSWLYRERTWERGGSTYKAGLKIKRWKKFLPDGAALFKGGFRKKRLGNPHAAYIQRFILETCRAELTHWVILLFSIIFFIWNSWWIGMVMIVYGFLTNMPCIVTQRYNRVRLKRVYRRLSSVEGEIRRT